MSQPWAEQCQPCLDEECEGVAEPEQDGDLHYWACTTCGSESGYRRSPVQPQSGACQLGVPEDLRRLVSLGRVDLPPDDRVFIELSRRPE